VLPVAIPIEVRTALGRDVHEGTRRVAGTRCPQTRVDSATPGSTDDIGRHLETPRSRPPHRDPLIYAQLRVIGTSALSTLALLPPSSDTRLERSREAPRQAK